MARKWNVELIRELRRDSVEEARVAKALALKEKEADAKAATAEEQGKQ